MANLLQLKINVRISHLETQCTYNSCAKIACCSSELIFMFLYDHSCIQNASEHFISCIHLSFVYFALLPTPQTLSLSKLFTCHPESPYMYIFPSIFCTWLYTCILGGIPTQLNLVQGNDVTVWKVKLYTFDLVNALADTCIEQYSNVTT